MKDAEVDGYLTGLLPDDGGYTFDGLVRRFREDHDWVMEKPEAEGWIHDALKRLEKSGSVVVTTKLNCPLLYGAKPMGVKGGKP